MGDKKVRNGHIKRITDQDIQSSVLEVMGTNVSTNYITCPADPNKTLGIKLPFLVMILKNLKKYFTFEVMVLDDKNIRRRFRASNYQSTTRVKPFICHANASGRRLEPDPVQLVGLHAPCVRDELHRDASRSDPRELPSAPHLLLGSLVLGGGASAGVQAFPAGPEGCPRGVGCEGLNELGSHVNACPAAEWLHRAHTALYFPSRFSRRYFPTLYFSLAGGQDWPAASWRRTFCSIASNICPCLSSPAS